jgi:hypothetical protein
MTTLTFRNVDASPTDPVETWPYEGLVAAVERGSLSTYRSGKVQPSAAMLIRMERIAGARGG